MATNKNVKPGDRIVLLGPDGHEYPVWLEEISPARAAHLLAHLGLQRRLKTQQVNKLSRTMAAGHWNDLNGDFFIFDEQGQLLQGQHRCHSVIKSERSIWVFCVGGISEKAIFDIDIDLSGRTFGDVLGMYHEKYATDLAATVQLMTRWANNSMQYYASVADTRTAYQLLKRHPSLRHSVAWCNGQLTQAPVKLLPTSMLSWCHYVFTRVHPEMGLNFVEILTWQTDIRPDKECPACTLRDRIEKAKKAQRRDAKMTIIEKIAWTIKAWGLYVQQMRSYGPQSIRWPAGEKFPKVLDSKGDIFEYEQIKKLPQGQR